jgi:hypothetical protein
MDDDTLAARAAALQKEGGGALTVTIVMHGDRADVEARAAAGDPAAQRLLKTLRQLIGTVEHKKRRAPAVCATCTTPLADVRWVAVIVAPETADYEQAMSLSICTGCASTMAEVQRRVIPIMSRIWPGSRAANPGTGGRA